MEFVIFTFYDGEKFEVVRKFQIPVWITNSVYFMDHDSEGRCYCKSFIRAGL